MRVLQVLALAVPCTLNPVPCSLSTAVQAQSLAVKNVTVIDGSDSTPRRDQTVLIRGNRIVAVGSSRSVRVPPGATVVDGRNRYLIPGLWDMHVHTDVPRGRDLLGLFVANGVLGVRDLAGDWARLQGWRREISAGTLVGPRMLLSGPYIEGGDVPIPHLLARTPAEAVAAVDSLARLGVDVIKLHTQLNRETYLAAASAARRRGLRVAGHVPRTVGAAEASDSGVGSIEHMLRIPVPCTPAESTRLLPRFAVQRVLAECSSADPNPLFRTLLRNRTWVVPTLTPSVEIASWPRRELPGDAFAPYLPDTLKQFVAQLFPMPPDVPPGADSIGQRLFAKRLALVGTLHRAGIGILTGTDSPLRNSPPGFGLHQELALLVRAGMSPFQALRSATLLPAHYFGMQDSLGRIAPNMVADLVLLSANPLLDIGNTRRIEAVVLRGKLLNRQSLQQLIDRARR
jgi:hypothetical protein